MVKFSDTSEAKIAIHDYIMFYNFARPHMGIENQAPTERYFKRLRAFNHQSVYHRRTRSQSLLMIRKKSNLSNKEALLKKKLREMKVEIHSLKQKKNIFRKQFLLPLKKWIRFCLETQKGNRFMDKTVSS